MFSIICKLFIKDYNDTNNPKVREDYGIVFSIFSILCNVFLVIFKLFVSFMTNSVSIRADAFNNLSDVGSNLATLFGFKLSNKHADSDHPYGHGRYEYVAGMVVSFLILLMGFEAIKESIEKIIHPSDINYSIIALVILIASILVKLVMFYMNSAAGKKIDSETLKAAGQDSIGDSITTCATLIGLLVYRFTNYNLDAYIGLAASILVLKSGIGIFTDVLDTILGKAPDKQLIKNIEKTITAHEEVLGIHDLMLHDYGPSHRFMSLHAEVDANNNVLKIHDAIDNIEMEILDKYKILTCIHMDPVDSQDELTNNLKIEVKKIVTDINSEYNIHDLRIVTGPTHTNIVFDVLLPADDEVDIEQLRNKISDNVKKLDNNYRCVINFDRAFC